MATASRLLALLNPLHTPCWAALSVQNDTEITLPVFSLCPTSPILLVDFLSETWLYSVAQLPHGKKIPINDGGALPTFL